MPALRTMEGLHHIAAEHPQSQLARAHAPNALTDLLREKAAVVIPVSSPCEALAVYESRQRRLRQLA